MAAILLPLCLNANNFSGSADDTPHRLSTFFPQEQKYEMMRKMTTLDTFNRPILTHSHYTPGGFVIHYDIEGKNAVPLEDLNNNGVPDYVDSVAYYFDYAKQVFVDFIGYKEPLKDGIAGGGVDLYDVYLLDCGKEGYYGYANLDKRVFSEDGVPMYISYTVIDNDFSPTDSVDIGNSQKRKTFKITGIDAVKFTSAHEYHHAVQFSYSETYSLLHEMTSTWMESRVIPETIDFLQFPNDLLKYPSKYNFGEGTNGDMGYAYSIFGEYTYIQYGDSLLLRTWELVGKGINGYKALDSAFIEIAGTGLAQEWVNFTRWLYFTGNRSIEGKYLRNSKDLPEITFFDDIHYTAPGLTRNWNLKSFEFRAARVQLPGLEANYSNDTLDIIMCNANINAVLKGVKGDTQCGLALVNNPLDNYRKVDGINYYIKTDPKDGTVFFHLFPHPGHPPLHCIDYAFPNPLSYREHTELFLPVPCKTPLNRKVDVAIFNSEMASIFNSETSFTKNDKSYRVESINGIRAIRLTLTDFYQKLTPGVYIFKVSYNTESIFGKLLVK